MKLKLVVDNGLCSLHAPEHMTQENGGVGSRQKRGKCRLKTERQPGGS